MKQEVVTFGCRLNAYESEVIKSNLLVAGLDDVIVFNTCSVTKEAERQARQSIRRARRNNPNAKIIVTGCAAQISPEKFSKMEEVDKILGNEEKLHAHNYNFGEKISVNDIMSVKETASHFVGSIEGKARAFVQVQNGCNHRCTFCIIPYGRGNSRSVPIGEIVKQVRQLVESGYNEVVITGVDITDYGKDLPGQPTLGQMLRRLLALVPNLSRLRLSSVDVAELDNDIYGLIENEPRLMPHFHISLQAGDDMVLKRMKRRHKRQDVVDFTQKVRGLRPDSAFGADIIAGFPTETDEMFENTLNLISEAGLQYLHIFPYSEREGTPAAKMPQVAKDIRKERAAKLREAGEKELIKHLQKNIGKTLKAVVEKDMIARAEDFSEISINKELEIGSVVDVNVIRLDGSRLLGSL
ncbi:MAG: tRNA (N(6)-L-threonylcarbamoyladenosine(37)-C(2))-methylthiotransferase MtaB [Alphaproteobacteria bacterium CG11_big_fil_rev_8_21_14_0_20_39_49]|nr:MAG: tRNA (N(6)-L-threonylcarbamoyladenosine(37)-C(2))-methylthiotransferase MtaB [Alphaproteobacteria bacterium CG11_big_fil_rev_8_21_14_0_20_39_49]